MALIGRTNVGKSTFLNRILDAKVSIVSNSPQTTRRQILGIKTTRQGQIVFFDSPGIHKPQFKLNERMMKDVHNSLMDADIILYFIEVKDFREDEFVLNMIRSLKKPSFLIINKIDLFKKPQVLRQIDIFKDKHEWKEIIPISALAGDNLDRLEKLIFRYLPENTNIFPPDGFTRQSETYYLSELIREKMLRLIRHELPFTTGVKIQEITEKEKITYIRAEILVESVSQRKILIGKHGHLIKQIGESARIELEDYFEEKVYLDLFVKVMPNWRNTPHILKDIFD